MKRLLLVAAGLACGLPDTASLPADTLTPSLVAAGFSRPPVVDRVEALLVPPRPSARLAADWVWLLVVAALGVASVDAIHHSAEMLVGGLVVLLT